MKKTIALLAALVMGATLFAGCGGSTAATSEAPASSAPAASSEAASEAAPAGDASSQAASEVAPAGDAALPETFILGLDASFPPMGFTDENNEIIGVDIDLAKAVCEKLGMTFEAKPIDWDAKDMELSTGKITCIWNGLTITDERVETYEMSRPYMKNEQVIVVMNGSDIASKADLAGKIVAAQKDSSGLEALMADEICASIQDGTPKEYADYVTAMGDLELGRCDAIVMDSIVADYYITANQKDMKVLEDKMAAEEYGIGFKKGDTALMEAVENALSELAADGTVAEISQKWFGREDMIITY